VTTVDPVGIPSTGNQKNSPFSLQSTKYKTKFVLYVALAHPGCMSALHNNVGSLVHGIKGIGMK